MRAAAGLLILASAVGLAGCEHAENYRWAREQFDSPATQRPALVLPAGSPLAALKDTSIQVYSFPTPADPKPTTSVKDLSDRGQAALIEALSHPAAAADKLSSLSKPLGGGDPDVENAATLDETFKRTLVATVTKGFDAKPGDRLVRTWIVVRPRNFVFQNYSVVATDNETLNIEAITNQTTASASATLGDTASRTSTSTVTPPSGSTVPTLTTVLAKVLGTSAGLTGGLSNQYTTSATINQQYVKLSADIRPDELRIYRESERNLDVAGNTLVALTLRTVPEAWHDTAREVDTQRVTGLTLVEAGKLIDPDKINHDDKKPNLKVGLEKSAPRCPLVADVSLLFETREVKKNARSYVEGQQSAAYVRKATTPRTVELVSGDDVRKASWRIYGGHDPQSAHPLKLDDPFSQTLPLDFSSYEQARAFTIWLKVNYDKWISQKARLALGVGGLSLYSGDDALPLLQPPYEARPFRDDVALPTHCQDMKPKPAVAAQSAPPNTPPAG